MGSDHKNSSKSLSDLYNLTLKHLGPIAARQAVSAAVENIIFDIQEEGLEFTPEIFENKLDSYVQDFKEVSIKIDAA